jgi:hypothetical protein
MPFYFSACYAISLKSWLPLSFKRDLNMDATSISVLASAILALVSTGIGAKYWTKVKQLLGLLNEIIAAAEDDKISEEEFQDIVAKAKALLC